MEIDTANFFLDRQFDCIYSNKVLHHLPIPEFQKSLQLQVRHLKNGGIIIMTLWYGTHREKFYEGLRFVYYTEQEIRKLIPDGLKIEAIERYTEIEQDDSLLVILKGGSETYKEHMNYTGNPWGFPAVLIFRTFS